MLDDKPLPEPMAIYHLCGPVQFIWEYWTGNAQPIDPYNDFKTGTLKIDVASAHNQLIGISHKRAASK